MLSTDRADSPHCAQPLGIHEPVYSWLTFGMITTSGEPTPLEQLIHPVAEPEIAFVLGAALDIPATATGVLRATEAVVPAIEGGLTTPVPLRRGRSVVAEFDGLGSVEVFS
jgi:2-keto-4-pentenoate hydratase